MPTFKIVISEKDGVEYEYPVEYDLLQALNELGFDSFNEDLILCNEIFENLFDNEGNILLGV